MSQNQQHSLNAIATATLKAIRPDGSTGREGSPKLAVVEPEPELTIPCLPENWYEQAAQWRRESLVTSGTDETPRS